MKKSINKTKSNFGKSLFICKFNTEKYSFYLLVLLESRIFIFMKEM